MNRDTEKGFIAYQRMKIFLWYFVGKLPKGNISYLKVSMNVRESKFHIHKHARDTNVFRI